MSKTDINHPTESVQQYQVPEMSLTYCSFGEDLGVNHIAIKELDSITTRFTLYVTHQSMKRSAEVNSQKSIELKQLLVERAVMLQMRNSSFVANELIQMARQELGLKEEGWLAGGTPFIFCRGVNHDTIQIFNPEYEYESDLDNQGIFMRSIDEDTYDSVNGWKYFIFFVKLYQNSNINKSLYFKIDDQEKPMGDIIDSIIEQVKSALPEASRGLVDGKLYLGDQEVSRDNSFKVYYD